jgi:hypothetical protein
LSLSLSASFTFSPSLLVSAFFEIFPDLTGQNFAEKISKYYNNMKNPFLGSNPDKVEDCGPRHFFSSVSEKSNILDI